MEFLEAIDLHAKGMVEDGIEIPTPSTVEEATKTANGGSVKLIDVTIPTKV